MGINLCKERNSTLPVQSLEVMHMPAGVSAKTAGPMGSFNSSTVSEPSQPGLSCGGGAHSNRRVEVPNSRFRPRERLEVGVPAARVCFLDPRRRALGTLMLRSGGKLCKCQGSPHRITSHGRR